MKFRSFPSGEKALNCSVDNLELFSCSLANEDETALSILDPVTVAMEINPLSNRNQRRPKRVPASGADKDGGDECCVQVFEVRTYEQVF